MTTNGTETENHSLKKVFVEAYYNHGYVIYRGYVCRVVNWRMTADRHDSFIVVTLQSIGYYKYLFCVDA